MWNLATARAQAKLTVGDTSKDTALTMVMRVVEAQLENLLERGLFIRRVVGERYLHVNSRRIYLFRYPIQSVQSPSNVTIHYRNGWLEGYTGTDELLVTYTGGIGTPTTLPDDLEFAMWGAFAFIWSRADPNTGLSAVGSGDVKSLTVFDAYKIDYDVGTSGSSAGASRGASAPEYWGDLAPWSNILMRYRRNVGGA
jgi:hypothetical protein